MNPATKNRPLEIASEERRYFLGARSFFASRSRSAVTFESDNVYDQRDAEGFIKLTALRLRLAKKLRAPKK